MRFRRWSGARGLRRALLIAGPTASGKSRRRARARANVRRDDRQRGFDAGLSRFRILTARPTHDEEGQARHRLFGEIDGAVNYSVGRWARRARDILREIGERPFIFVGGTGLYFRALTEGLSDMPAVAAAVRDATRARAEGRASADLHAELAVVDPVTAARLRPSDRQRILARPRSARRHRPPARLLPRRARGAGAETWRMDRPLPRPGPRRALSADRDPLRRDAQ